MRDYIHVTDLAQAHILALGALDRGSRLYNLGNGEGFTVKEVIDTAREVTGRPIRAEIGPRRTGDPAVLVTLRCRSIDRIFLQAYVPRLQTVGEVCTFLRWQRKFPIPSSAAFGRFCDEYRKALYRFAEANAIPLVHFKKGQNKEEVARPYLALPC